MKLLDLIDRTIESVWVSKDTVDLTLIFVTSDNLLIKWLLPRKFPAIRRVWSDNFIGRINRVDGFILDLSRIQLQRDTDTAASVSTSITIPTSVTTITSVTIPTSVTTITSETIITSEISGDIVPYVQSDDWSFVPASSYARMPIELDTGIYTDTGGMLIIEYYQPLIADCIEMIPEMNNNIIWDKLKDGWLDHY